MATLLLVRHGETDWNAEGRLQGHTDRPLNERGRSQARALAERLAGDGRVDAIYSSDLARALETAQILGEKLGVPVVTDPDLRERNWGSWEGLLGHERDEVEYVGEAVDAHGTRVVAAVHRIAERHPDERVVVVTHGGSLRRIQVAVYGMALPVVDNCTVWAVEHGSGTFRPIE